MIQLLHIVNKLEGNIFIMEIFWCIVLLILGLIIIIKCGDWFVDAASWFAEISGYS
ncbi:MAG: hypothetical protein ACLU5J_06860 [Christensenellales bacterium]